MALQAQNLSVRAPRSGPKQISDFSLAVQPGELVVLVGSNRAEATALLEALAGFDQELSSEVTINEVSLYANLKAFRPYIGFVPAEDGLHANLTVTEILNYESYLRMPRGISTDAYVQRVNQVLSQTGMQAAGDRRFGTLSDLEKRLVSIAVALVNRPSLLFVDISAAPLSSSDEAQITRLLRDQARAGCTVLQAAESAQCALLADKVILLENGGTLAWYGPAEEAIQWFSSQAQPGAAEDRSLHFADVLAMVHAPPAGKAGAWSERYKAQPAYQKYIDDPLKGRLPDLHLQDRPLSHFRGSKNEKLPPQPARQAGGLLKWSLFMDRGVRVLFRERTGLVMLATVPLIALTDLLISNPNMDNPLLGDADMTPMTLGLVVFLATLLSALLFRNEIIKERAMFRREQRSGSSTLPYTLSKVWIVVFFALYEGFVWALVHFLASGGSGGITALPAYWATLTLMGVIGGLIGLLASAVARTPHSVPVWILALVIPQLFLSGSIIPLPHLNLPARLISWASPSRYAFEAMLTASGYGKDLVNDRCWQLPEAQRLALTEAEKQNCTCLGDNIYSKCNFPGIHQFFTFVMEQPRPTEPAPDSRLNNPPVQPQLRAGESVEAYSAEVNKYTLQLEQYQASSKAYTDDLNKYLASITDWQRNRSLVIGNAEGVLAKAYDHYGEAFQVNILRNWLILIGMSLILVVPLIWIQKRKGGV